MIGKVIVCFNSVKQITFLDVEMLKNTSFACIHFHTISFKYLGSLDRYSQWVLQQKMTQIGQILRLSTTILHLWYNFKLYPLYSQVNTRSGVARILVWGGQCIDSVCWWCRKPPNWRTSAAMSKNALSPIFIANITFITLQPKRT